MLIILQILSKFVSYKNSGFKPLNYGTASRALLPGLVVLKHATAMHYQLDLE
jgi:hypothetical protein